MCCVGRIPSTDDQNKVQSIFRGVFNKFLDGILSFLVFNNNGFSSKRRLQHNTTQHKKEVNINREMMGRDRAFSASLSTPNPPHRTNEKLVTYLCCIANCIKFGIMVINFRWTIFFHHCFLEQLTDSFRFFLVHCSLIG